MRPGTVGNSQDANRPGVARLLARLVTDAGLQTVGAEWRAPMLIDQVKAIWTAARQLDLDVGVSLPDFLCTSPAKFGELVQRIEQAPARRFTHSRPHGVLIVRAAGVGAGVLQPVAGEPIPVLGRLAVFGERAEPGREGRAERAARAPYLAACVVGRAEEGGPVQVLSAYAHPCAGDAHWMLVDSDMERRTLEQLCSVQAWLGTKRGLQVAIEKPMFDIGGDAEADEAPRPPCIPDFLVRAAGADGARTTVIAETMGFANQEYRQRKDRTHAAMAAAVGRGAPVVLHDFHEPAEQPQAVRDARFWRDMRWALTGPDLASPGQRS